MLQQRAADAVHDAFRDAGGAGRIHHVQRRVELDARELEWSAGRAEVPERYRRGKAGKVGVRDDVGDDYDFLHRGQSCQHAADRRQRIQRLAAVEIAVGREQHPRPDLPEAVQHAVDAEIRRARRPHRAEAGRGEHGDDGFRQVRQEAGDPVARADAELAQPGRDPRDFGVQFAVGQGAPGSAFVAEHECDVVVAAGEQVLREIEARVREPLRSRHPVALLQHRRAAGRTDDRGELDERGPERFPLVHRPAPERRIVARWRAVALACQFGEARQVGRGDLLQRGRPDRFGHGEPVTCPGSWVPIRLRAWSR